MIVLLLLLPQSLILAMVGGLGHRSGVYYSQMRKLNWKRVCSHHYRHLSCVCCCCKRGTYAGLNDISNSFQRSDNTSKIPMIRIDNNEALFGCILEQLYTYSPSRWRVDGGKALQLR